jgi:phosphate acetyltransferase
VAAEHSHHSAELAVAMVLAGEAQTLMKGSLHTDELLAEVVKKVGGCAPSGGSVIASCCRCPPFLVRSSSPMPPSTSQPTLEDKRDIIQNAIDLAHAIGIAEPKVAILSAVETVTIKIPSTLEAGALCKMADRGQIVGRRSWTVRWPSTTPSTNRRRKPKASSRRWRAKPTFWWCPTWKPATCWPSN